jgi:hypothetical protein
MFMKLKLERAGKEVVVADFKSMSGIYLEVVAYFKSISGYLPGCTEEN